MKEGWLIIIRSSVYGSDAATSGLDMALAAAAFDRPVTVLFEGDGLSALTQGDAQQLERKTVTKAVGALPLFGVRKVAAYAVTAAEHGLIAAPGIELLDRAGRDNLIRNHQHVWVF